MAFLDRAANEQCERPPGERFGWLTGSGPCDCGPCLRHHNRTTESRVNDGPTV